MERTSEPIDLLFENSWEVCNKIGGIYTVLSTKAKTLQKLYKDKVIFIGPDVWSNENPSPYFVESDVLLKSWRKQAKLPYGISVRVGRWDIPGRPIVVLVKFDGMYEVKNEFYGKMWEQYGVDSLHAYGDYDEGCAFGLASAIVIESICEFEGIRDKRVIAHFDEWTTGMGLLYVKSHMPSVGTIFTTHATCIGRSICGNGKPLYDYIHGYNGDQMAAELNMQSKHSLEKAAAHAADCFTTVSDITAIECEQLLERRPVVTPNGFEQNFVPTKGKFVGARKAARETLLNVASSLLGYTLPDDTFIVATSGRCEYRNKGIDLYLDSIARLSQKQLKRKVVAFVMVPAWVKEARADVQNALPKKRKQALDDPYLTHTLNNPGEDPINCRIHSLGLSNAKNENIKIIYVPCYLNGEDGIFNRAYYDLLIGMDATVFPSYYEPWGYTPLESVAFGVPTVTTTLSGFGQWILSLPENTFADSGVNVIARGDYNYDEVADKIARSLEYLIKLDPAELVMISSHAMNTAAMAAWSYFIEYYVEAFKIALDAAAARVK
jgi:glycosyltransferase involved in cell wall biosynthesis